MIKSYKGNSLVVTVVISLVLAIICSSIILLAYYNRQQQLKNDIELQLQRDVESSTNLILADSSVYPNPVSDTIDLFGEGKDSLEIKKELWGIFQVATVKSFHNRVSRERSFFYGPAMPDYMNACLYVADHRRPIAVVGYTKLIGDGYLPGAGIKTSYIGQRGFENNKLIAGEIKTSQDSLPVLSKNVLDYLHKVLSGNLIISSKFISDSLEQDFSDTAVYIYSKEKISLSNCSFKGHIQIKSDIAIEIDPSAQLNNVMLVAPCIRFKEGTKAIAQALASDSLVIEKNCVFEYPSALILKKENNSTLQNRLLIAENCKIKGVVLSLCNNNDLYKTFVEVGGETKIMGVIYTMGYLALKGNIEGIAMTDFFIYKSPTTTYENYLVDITINRIRLPGYFLIPSIFNSSKTQDIIQWVK
jgi:hypothetical protein